MIVTFIETSHHRLSRLKQLYVSLSDLKVCGVGERQRKRGRQREIERDREGDREKGQRLTGNKELSFSSVGFFLSSLLNWKKVGPEVPLFYILSVSPVLQFEFYNTPKKNSHISVLISVFNIFFSWTCSFRGGESSSL